VDETFNKIKSYGRKTTTNNNIIKGLKIDKTVFQQLLRSLSSLYGVIKDTIKTKIKDTDDIKNYIIILKDKKSELKKITHISRKERPRLNSKKNLDFFSRHH